MNLVLDSSGFANVKEFFIDRYFNIIRGKVVNCWIWDGFRCLISIFFAFLFPAIPVWDGTHMNSIFLFGWISSARMFVVISFLEEKFFEYY